MLVFWALQILVLVQVIRIQGSKKSQMSFICLSENLSSQDSLGISVIYTILFQSRTRLIFAVARRDVILYHFTSLSGTGGGDSIQGIRGFSQWRKHGRQSNLVLFLLGGFLYGSFIFLHLLLLLLLLFTFLSHCCSQ